MADALPSPTTLAQERKPRLANETREYAEARRALLAEEIALQRRLDAVAEQRRALPEGPEIVNEYTFIDPNSGETVGISALFGAHDTLVTYF